MSVKLKSMKAQIFLCHETYSVVVSKANTVLCCITFSTMPSCVISCTALKPVLYTHVQISHWLWARSTGRTRGEVHIQHMSTLTWREGSTIIHVPMTSLVNSWSRKSWQRTVEFTSNIIDPSLEPTGSTCDTSIPVHMN